MQGMNPFASATVRLCALLCCMLAQSAQAVPLIWGSGNWGDEWSNTATPAQGNTTPTTISGTSFRGPSDPVASSGSSFNLGLTRDNGASYVSTASVSEDVRVIGTIVPDPAHIGQLADIFVVTRINDTFYMKNQSSVWLVWNGRVPDLVPFREDVLLTSTVTVDIFTGKLGVAGDHRMYLGYAPASDAVLRYTPSALRLTISP